MKEYERFKDIVRNYDAKRFVDQFNPDHYDKKTVEVFEYVLGQMNEIYAEFLKEYVIKNPNHTVFYKPFSKSAYYRIRNKATAAFLKEYDLVMALMNEVVK